jgi:twitching motility protein PilT
MVAMDLDLLRLYRERKISRENALIYAANPETLKKKLDN